MMVNILNILLALAVSTVLAVPGQKRATCPDYALVVARGTGEPQGPSAGFSGVGINGMTNQTFSKVPNGVEYDVVYPADASPTSPDIGRDDAVRYIKQSQLSCPQQKFALLGYSQGATVVLETLQALDSDDIISAVVLLGNPYQKKNQKSTVDQKGGDKTRGKTGVLYPSDPGIALSKQLNRSGKVLNICYTRDLVCTGISLTTLNGRHFLYPFTPSVQSLGTNLLVTHLR